ncbi:hypothetical protein BJI67_10460 [Acidihalobacter aeolianus]|uniref:gamma-glutamyl-gamma-aminobutyrate hydrolase n=1 Tax=Acidihalobacter aeolianus TaxID=2792603 RepID=A0A1D8K911_9GAMM|nr:gamma-glutamyl-gamma-aminobutyrate hydrolase family protein [Acidihalobacter aeolianus]AOV17425.1 hypothetical protein BJI67_10460 [Acidihalobacter aeolianus]
MSERKPLIAVPADTRLLGHHWFHAAGEKYLRAVAEAAGGLPLVVPAMAEAVEIDALLERVDGLLFPGSPSNVEPALYGGPPSVEGTLHDPARDALSLPLIRAALDRGVPLFAICRGLQEVNVALGGTLHQRVQEIPGMQDHRENPDLPVEAQYGIAHEVTLVPDGLLDALIGRPRIAVNSLHWQGVDRLAPGLRAEARADDGLVEAFTLPDAPGFNLAVQWHPEWMVHDNPDSVTLFEAFGEACRQRSRGD